MDLLPIILFIVVILLVAGFTVVLIWLYRKNSTHYSQLQDKYIEIQKQLVELQKLGIAKAVATTATTTTAVAKPAATTTTPVATEAATTKPVTTITSETTLQNTPSTIQQETGTTSTTTSTTIATVPKTVSTPSPVAAASIDQNSLITNAMGRDLRLVGFNYVEPSDLEMKAIVGNYMQRVFEDLQAIGCYYMKKMVDQLTPEDLEPLKTVSCADLQAKLNEMFSSMVIPADSPVSKQAVVTHLSNLVFAIATCTASNHIDTIKLLATIKKLTATMCFMV